jgi:REP element-mobilizing transposase RayT
MPAHHIQFFTATIQKWIPLLNNYGYKQIIVDSMAFLVGKKRCEIFAFVIMPNHIHVISKINSKLKRQDVQRDFLKYTSQQIRFALQDKQSKLLSEFEVNLKDRRYQFWQRNPLSVNLFSREVIEQKLDYIHANPVKGKWNLVEDIVDYKYSSASFYEEDKLEFAFLKHYMDVFE